MKTAIPLFFSLFIAMNSLGQQADSSGLMTVIKEADRIIATDPRDFFKNVESFIVYDRGHIIFENYYQGIRKDSLHHIQSQTKSIVSLLLGIAIDQGIIPNENEPAARYFPEYFKKEDSLKFRVTIRDLVTMSAGFCHAGGGLYLRPSDVLKIGEMILNSGTYQGKRIVSENWIRRSFQSCFTTEFGGKDYGYFWWTKEMAVNKDSTTRVLSAEGAGGQSLFIIPEYHLVISFTEHNYTTPQVGPWVLRESILPNL